MPSNTSSTYSAVPSWIVFFVFLFLFRYVRLIVNTISFHRFKDVSASRTPTLTTKDCTIIIPTVDPEGIDFPETIRAALVNEPAEILIITVGDEKVAATKRVCSGLGHLVRILQVGKASKREQMIAGVRETKTRIVVSIDDHVFLGRDFLRTILPPFEDARVGGVGTKKQVRRVNLGWTLADFTNFLGTIYLERRNFDMAATTNIDGGLSCLSGRAACYRTAILADPNFQHAFLNEYQWIPFKGTVGPLNVGDDKMITRWLAKNDWDVRIQFSNAGKIETTLGDPKKWILQCLRWVRTTWRDNPNALIAERTVWRRHPWCVYSVYLTSFVNFALFYDTLLLVSLWYATADRGQTYRTNCMIVMTIWILASKLVKPMPHFVRQPGDLLYFPGLVLFGYLHSLIKLWALFTAWNIQWSGRRNV